MIYILGHKNPDTDSVCSPIIVEWYLNNIKNQEAKAILHNDINRETEFILEYWGFKKPEIVDKLPSGAKVFLVDTTNPDELPLIQEDTEIIEIVDHHKLGGISTSKPISVNIKPIACTTTILYLKFLEENPGLKIPKKIAGLMLSAILSDTLNFRSPTTTDIDKKVAHELERMAEIENIDKYANKMFDAKSSIEGMSMNSIINADAKEYLLGSKKSLVAVFETVKPQVVIEKQTDITSEIQNIKSNDGYEMVFFFVIDILNQIAYYFFSGEQENTVISKGYNCTIADNGITALDGIVSRKKQIVPVLEENA